MGKVETVVKAFMIYGIDCFTEPNISMPERATLG